MDALPNPHLPNPKPFLLSRSKMTHHVTQKRVEFMLSFFNCPDLRIHQSFHFSPAKQVVKYVPEKHVAVKGVSVILKFVLDGSSVRYYRAQHDIKVIFIARPSVDPIKC